MGQKETRALCVGKVNIFIIYNDSYKEEVGKNVSNYKVVNSKYKIVCEVLLLLVLDYLIVLLDSYCYLCSHTWRLQIQYKKTG